MKTSYKRAPVCRTHETLSPAEDRLSSHGSSDGKNAIKMIQDFYIEDKEAYRTKVEEVTLFGPSKLEENAKKRIMRDTVDSKIRELKALNFSRPASGHRILRVATQTQLGQNRGMSKNRNKRKQFTTNLRSAHATQKNLDVFMRRKSDTSS